MDLILVCPKLIPLNSEGTLFRGFVTAEVVCLCDYLHVITYDLLINFSFSQKGINT